MKRLLLLPLVLSGCFTASLWYKDGHPPASSAPDHTDCSVEALQKVPPSNQTFSTPVYTTPTYVSCSQITSNCTVSGGSVLGGDIYTTDVNAGLRQNVVQKCMARRGWRIVDLPGCDQSAVNKFNANPVAYTKGATLTAQSCAVLHQGDWHVFNP